MNMGASTYEWLYYIVFYNPKYYISVFTEIGCVDRKRLSEPISVVWTEIGYTLYSGCEPVTVYVCVCVSSIM